MPAAQALIPILPCNDMAASRAFYGRLGFVAVEDFDDYAILEHPCGAVLHLTPAVEGWLVPGRNPFGLYFHIENVDAVAARFGLTAQAKEWGMYECSMSDPDETLVRIGWPLGDDAPPAR